MKNKIKSLWKNTKQIFGFSEELAEVIISGLTDDEHLFKKSIQEEAQKMLEKIRKQFNDAESISINVKSAQKPKTRIYELHGLVKLPGFEIRSTVNDRELYLALNKLSKELETEARKKKSKIKSKAKR
ncbi:MAG: hypothetical protein ABH803_02035 [Candidatus Micrarchaeota archaeon]